MTDDKKTLTMQEAEQVSGGSLIGAADGAATVLDGIFKVLNASGNGVDGLTRPSPKPSSGNTCCCNCRRM
ncbi:hypothetical protein VV869_23370 [Photobacterium sp. MCCC 1A19761]|uniref:hypothetical protein n=1 Tax=Photobacterium sp. MCCC 1A19761 TaxID=3115000 RepID=UPI00307D7370